MNENVKTITFAAAAAAAIGIALFTQPEDPAEVLQASRKGKSLFDFRATDASYIEVVAVSKDTKKPKTIRVSEDHDGWFIHRDKFKYPADANNQLGAMATSLSGLLIHDLESDKQSDHAKYGVLDPSLPEEVRGTGNNNAEIGKLIILKNAEKKNLAQLIIGKAAQLPEIQAAETKLKKLTDANASVDEINFQKEEIENLEKGTIRYARKPGSAEVISVKFEKLENITTNFIDWVEQDFLDLDQWNVKQVRFDNYEIIKTMVSRPGLPPQFKVPKMERKSMGKYTLAYTDGNWTSPDLKLAENESLDKDVLDDLKDSLDDLKIIDVDTKPGVLVDTMLVSLLKSMKTNNKIAFDQHNAQLRQIAQSMEQKGFYLDIKQDTNGLKQTLLCDKGEIHVGMKSGVEYLLRFGEAYAGNEDDENATGQSRYLYAIARSNPSLLEAPLKETVPQPLPPQATPKPDGNATKPGTPAIDENATAAYEKNRNQRNADIARINAANAAKQKEYDDKI
ncbi:MAG: DUF4340 domain-containing protein, partial [Opitutales bacterium]